MLPAVGPPARAPHASDAPRYGVLGTWIHAVDPARVLAEIGEWIRQGRRRYVAFANVHGIIEGFDEPATRRAFNEAGLTVPDGVPLVWLGRGLGHREVRRVYGPDTVLRLAELAAQRGWSCYFYGAAPGVGERLASVLAERFPGLRVAGVHAPPFRTLTEAEDAEDVSRINASGADLVFVGLGCPKQERWMADHRSQLTAAVLLGVGAAFDFHTGRVRQAPRWMMSAGLEWLFRLIQEPRRLWRRYLVYNPRFLFHVALQLLRLRRYPTDHPRPEMRLEAEAADVPGIGPRFAGGLRALDGAVLAALLFSMSWWVGVLALRRFDFYDMSIFLDAGWRVARGQRMYVDFFYIAGPVHPYLYAALIRLLGFNKWAVLVFLLGTQAVVLASSYAMARRAFSPLVAGLLAAAAAAACVLTLAHPWYDLTAFALLVAGWAAVDVFDPFAEPRHSWSAAVAGATAALAFLAKTNVGLAGGGLLLLAFAVRAAIAHRWRPVVSYALSGLAVLALLILTLASPAEYFRQNFVDFGTSGRLARLGRMGDILTDLPYTFMALAAAVMAWAGGPRWRSRSLPTQLMIAVVAVTGVFALWTGSSLVVGGGYLVGVMAILLCRLAADLPQADEGRPVRRVPAAAWHVAAALAALLILNWAAGRALVGWSWRPSNVRADYSLRTPGFEGWRCFGRTGEGVDRAAEAIRALVPARDTLLVIPDATVLYGMTGHDSYRGVPWAWDITSSPARGSRLYERTVRRLHEDRPQWILVHFQNDAPANATLALLAHLQLAPMIAAEYRPAWSWGDFVLLHRTGGDGGGGPPAAPR